MMIVFLCTKVKNVVHIPKKNFQIKPILDSCKNLKKIIGKNLKYEAFFLQF